MKEKYTGSTLTDSAYFVYDGWNMIQELDSSLAIKREHVWGLDLSQGLQGAGGVGGLLATVVSGVPPESDTCYYVTYDANGNVSEYIKSSDSTVAAHYEYGPFGQTTASTGSAFPFRFSTKYLDAETGLYYYGFRYYDPDLGRWVNRDPIGERSGVNLYLFCFNNSLVENDFLGMIAHDSASSEHDTYECCLPWRDYAKKIIKLLDLEECASVECRSCSSENTVAAYVSRRKLLVLCTGHEFSEHVIREEIQHIWDAKAAGWCGRDPTCSDIIHTDFHTAYCHYFPNIPGDKLKDWQINKIYNFGVNDMAGEGCIRELNKKHFSYWRELIMSFTADSCWGNKDTGNINWKDIKMPEKNKCCASKEK